MYDTNHLCSTSKRNWLIHICQYVHHGEKKKLLAGFTQVAVQKMGDTYSDLDIFLCKMNGSFNPLEVKTNILGSFQIYVPGQQIRPL